MITMGYVWHRSSITLCMKNLLTQEQVIVSPNTATFEVIGNGKHFGQVFCPFCSKSTVVLGPKSGMGVSWIHSTCNHSQGIAAGCGYEITILFKGFHDDMANYNHLS